MLAGAAAGSVLDKAVLALIFGPRSPSSDSKMRSKRLKFIIFAREIGAWPLLPTSTANMFRYALWLPANGVKSGWKGVRNYLTEVANWNKQLGFDDPRDAVPFHWAQFRLNFRRLVTAEHPSVKLPIRPAMLLAMALDADLGSPTDLRDIACYFMLFFTGLRVGHVAATSPQDAPHALRFEDLCFLPSFAHCEKVLICVRSTKTRFRASGLPFWTVIRHHPHLDFCPVALLQAHYIVAFKGDPRGFVFTASTSSAPLPRRTFTNSLRTRLEAVRHRLSIDFDLSKFSGVSFRKGCLSTLGALGVPAHRLADHADHASVESSRSYTVDTIEDRAANSDYIASAFVSAT